MPPVVLGTQVTKAPPPHKLLALCHEASGSRLRGEGLEVARGFRFVPRADVWGAATLTVGCRMVT